MFYCKQVFVFSWFLVGRKRVREFCENLRKKKYKCWSFSIPLFGDRIVKHFSLSTAFLRPLTIFRLPNERKKNLLCVIENCSNICWLEESTVEETKKRAMSSMMIIINSDSRNITSTLMIFINIWVDFVCDWSEERESSLYLTSLFSFLLNASGRNNWKLLTEKVFKSAWVNIPSCN